MAGHGWQASQPTVVSGLGVDGGGSPQDGRIGRIRWRRAAGLPAVAKERRVREGGSNSVVESQPSKLLVAGSIPVSRSSLRSPQRRPEWLGRSETGSGPAFRADVAQLAERVLGKDEVTGSTPVIGSIA